MDSKNISKFFQRQKWTNPQRYAHNREWTKSDQEKPKAFAEHLVDVIQLNPPTTSRNIYTLYFKIQSVYRNWGKQRNRNKKNPEQSPAYDMTLSQLKLKSNYPGYDMSQLHHD